MKTLLNVNKAKRLNFNFNLNRLDIMIIDPDTGKVEQKFRGRSYVRNFIRQIYRFPTSYSQVHRINGAPVSSDHTPRRFLVTGQTAVDRRGILIGSGDTAVNISDYLYSTQITSDFIYSDVSVADVVANESTIYFDIYRAVTSQVDSLTIRELAYCTDYQSSNPPFMFARDVLPEALILNNTESKVIKYRLYFDGFLKNIGTFLKSASEGVDATGDFIRTTGGTGYLYNNYQWIWQASPNDNLIGITIGEGDTPATIDDYDLESIHNTTDILHTAQLVTEPEEDIVNNVGYFQIQRTFTNVTASNKTVSEVGYVTLMNRYSQYFYIFRRALAQPVVLEPDDALVVTFTFVIQP